MEATNKPQGWGVTRTGALQHYFYYPNLPNAGLKALCHYSLVPHPGRGLTPEVSGDLPACGTCAARVRNLGRERQPAAPPAVANADELTPGRQVLITRGKHAGKIGVLQRADPHLPDFWRVQLHGSSKALGFSEAQLRLYP